MTTDVRSTYTVVSSLELEVHDIVYFFIMPDSYNLCTVSQCVFQGDTVVVEFWAGNPRNNLMVKIHYNTTIIMLTNFSFITVATPPPRLIILLNNNCTIY